MKQKADQGIVFKNTYDVVCLDKDGKEKWREVNNNLVTTVGVNHVLDAVLGGSANITTWYLGIKDDAGTPAAGDTMASHGTWVEFQNYTGNRQAITFSSAAAGSIDNTSAVNSFAITGSDTVAGAFIVSDSVKGGTAGVLYGVVDFQQSRNVVNGDTLNVTVTLTAASA